MSGGRYTLIRLIGRGGMAEIWKAKVTGPSGFVKFLALKKILPDLAEDRVFVPMFVDEAKLEASLAHPNLIAVFDFGEEDDQLFLAMEYVPGGNVDRLVTRLHKAGETLPTDVALLIALEVTRGLAYAHAKTDASGQPLGIVHRDVSPHNIMVASSGEVKLGDFGIAKAASVIPRTAAGHVRGKLAYMSPEHIAGRSVDGRSDLFSLGVVLFEMVTGTRLFAGKSGDEISEQVKRFDPMADLDLAKVPEQVADLLVVLLQQDPGDRYANAPQLEEELGRRLGITGVSRARQTLAALVTRLFAKELAADAEDETADALTTVVPIAAGDRALAETVETPARSAPAADPSPATRTTTRRRRWPIAAAASLVALGAAGFGWWKLAHPSAHGPRRGGTLRIAMGLPAEDWNVFSIEQSRNRTTLTEVIEPLFKIGRDGEIVPWVLEGSELADAGRTVVLRLRTGVMFHEHPCLRGGGRAATGEDLAYSIREAFRRGAVALPIRGAQAFLAGDERALAITPTATGVSIALTDPAPFYESQIAEVRFIPHELAGCEDLQRMHQPVGTGPYRFTAPPRGGRFSLVRATHYWHRDTDGSELPYLDGLAIEPIDDLAGALARVGRGEIDILVPAPDDWPRVLDRSQDPVQLAEGYRGLGVDLVASTSRSRIALLGLFVGAGDHALRDPRIRVALSKSLDREALIRASERAISGPATRYLDPRMLGYDAKLPDHHRDPAAAQALLAAAGHAGGAGLKPITVGTMRDLKLGAELARQAAAIGLPMTVVAIPPASAFDSIENGTVDAILVVDIWRLRSGENAKLVPEVARFVRSPELARLHLELLATPDRAGRIARYRQLEEALLAEAPAIPIAWGDAAAPQEVYVVGRRMRSFHDPITHYARLDDLEHVWLAR